MLNQKKKKKAVRAGSNRKKSLPNKSGNLRFSDAYLWKVWNVSSIDSHLLLERKSELCLLPCTHDSRSICGDKCSLIYLCYFQEFWYPGHSSEELLVDVQTFFALSLLHVKVFLCLVIYKKKKKNIVFTCNGQQQHRIYKDKVSPQRSYQAGW